MQADCGFCEVQQGVFAALLHGSLDPERLRHMATSEFNGGVVVFCGVVRAETGDLQTSRLVYEAHSQMALGSLQMIGQEVEREFGAQLWVEHRLGEILPGEVAVVVAAAAPHRKSAFLACETMMERIKAEVPIWKKEFGPDGEFWVSGDQHIVS